MKIVLHDLQILRLDILH